VLNGVNQGGAAMLNFRSDASNALFRIRNSILNFAGIATLKYQKDILYDQMLTSNLANSGVCLTLYPVSDASNPSLLYLIARIVGEHDINRVLELGAGQSSLLFSEFTRIKSDLEIMTLEDNKDWYNYLRDKVRHDIVYAPLESVKVNSINVSGYAISNVLDRQFDMMLVDGPRGVKRYSRLGCLPLIKNNLSKEFIIIFGDAERIGERDTIKEVIRYFNKENIEVFGAEISGTSCQYILCTKMYRSVCFY